MSDTPRTDAIECYLHIDADSRYNAMASNARQLERELSQAIDALLKSVADLRGVQPAFEHLPAVELWNLRVPLGIHPAGSTLSRETLIALLKS